MEYKDIKDAIGKTCYVIHHLGGVGYYIVEDIINGVDFSEQTLNGVTESSLFFSTKKCVYNKDKPVWLLESQVFFNKEDADKEVIRRNKKYNNEHSAL